MITIYKYNTYTYSYKIYITNIYRYITLYIQNAIPVKSTVTYSILHIWMLLFNIYVI